ncbi:DUF4861 family protein [Labilibacter marinus]|uniref:DUF4861 family protein n=1 Tax=Labilibacter marinus TaxID=1477105 RepID=UPI000835F1C3|nr:DUF4861 family protein [Labilibacter marinus]
MGNLIKIFSILIAAIVFSSCNHNQNALVVSVTNPLNAERYSETINVALGTLASSSKDIVVIDQASKKEIRSQLLDVDADGIFEAIIFQSSFKANEKKEFAIKQGKTEIESSEVKTFARFVPERTDDFTWENDKVAFRVYGPVAQQLVEAGKKGGTLSGGVDCWLKKVDYSIIDKWYAGNMEKPGYYHNDHGEGLDNYHVGPSCGCGGTGVMVNGELYPHVNYTGYNVLSNGPIKSEFALDYAPYQAGESTIQEKKTLSIDLGSNFTKFVIEVEGTDTLTAGITLHDNIGVITANEDLGWASYWTPHAGEELGTAIVASSKYFAGYTKIISDVKDKSHLLVNLKVIDGKVEYYAGFAWSGSKQFSNQEEWKSHLSEFAQKIDTPLKVEVK